mmetsp:Transcript_43825/g.113132  ORF Transcript_43825/g.113132 Transcript_43825/m.113132 type:complete len:216 (+) Transcript_43825:506-1153(+)
MRGVLALRLHLELRLPGRLRRQGVMQHVLRLLQLVLLLLHLVLLLRAHVVLALPILIPLRAGHHGAGPLRPIIDHGLAHASVVLPVVHLHRAIIVVARGTDPRPTLPVPVPLRNEERGATSEEHEDAQHGEHPRPPRPAWAPPSSTDALDLLLDADTCAHRVGRGQLFLVAHIPACTAVWLARVDDAHAAAIGDAEFPAHVVRALFPRRADVALC